MMFNNLGIAHKGLPLFLSLLDIFAGVVAQLIAVCGLLVLKKQKLNLFTGVDLRVPGPACGCKALHHFFCAPSPCFLA